MRGKQQGVGLIRSVSGSTSPIVRGRGGFEPHLINLRIVADSDNDTKGMRPDVAGNMLVRVQPIRLLNKGIKWYS